jgi:cell division protein FtsN
MLWLTRAQLASGNAAAACGTARETLFRTTNENVRTLIEIERDRACAQSGGIATTAERTDIIMPQRPPTPADTSRAAARNTRAEWDARDHAAREQSARERAARVDAEQAAREQAARDQRAGSAQPAPAGPPVVLAPARPAAPLPDLGIAVDENVRQREQPPARTPADARTTSPTAPASPVDAAVPERAADSRPANTAEYAVQTAAFAERRAAETIAGELRAKGFDARIVIVPGNPYYRVRFGAFMTSAEAAAASLRIRDAGFATLVVNDVRLERSAERVP